MRQIASGNLLNGACQGFVGVNGEKRRRFNSRVEVARVMGLLVGDTKKRKAEEEATSPGPRNVGAAAFAPPRDPRLALPPVSPDTSGTPAMPPHANGNGANPWKAFASGGQQSGFGQRTQQSVPEPAAAGGGDGGLQGLLIKKEAQLDQASEEIRQLNLKLAAANSDADNLRKKVEESQKERDQLSVTLTAERVRSEGLVTELERQRRMGSAQQAQGDAAGGGGEMESLMRVVIAVRNKPHLKEMLFSMLRQ